MDSDEPTGTGFAEIVPPGRRRSRRADPQSQKADIKVVEKTAPHPSMKGAYVILTSGVTEVADTMYTEDVTGARYETQPENVGICRRYFEATYQMATPIKVYLR
ncbi:hypothetical protein ACFQ3B_01530 [Stackebrandtia endophytica]|uniref:hypothetical protein n=1 Tax=Stackebrandtia endophytica TaxID=1496996 RepID=UPI00114EF759|nr:hypothetical protein [Stackebrandtia endophytica]